MTVFALLFLIPIIVFIVEIVIIINLLQDKTINNNSKIVWLIVLLFGNLIGLIIYLAVPNKNILTE